MVSSQTFLVHPIFRDKKIASQIRKGVANRATFFAGVTETQNWAALFGNTFWARPRQFQFRTFFCSLSSSFSRNLPLRLLRDFFFEEVTKYVACPTPLLFFILRAYFSPLLSLNLQTARRKMRDAYLCVTSAKGVAVIMTPVSKELKRTFFSFFFRVVARLAVDMPTMVHIPLSSFDRSAASPPPLSHYRLVTKNGTSF